MTCYVLIADDIVMQKQPDPADGFIEAPDWVVCGMLYDENADPQYTNPPIPEPEPQSQPKRLELWSANMHVENGEVTSTSADSGIAMAFALGPETIMAIFVEPVAGDYGWNVNATDGQAKVTGRAEDHVIISVAGAVEPFDLSLQLFPLVG